MRLRRLVLSRYGMFTDHALDFGERNGDGADLHLVYGLNEAGKSTALTGFLDLLFGIEQQSRYHFLHGYESMRIESDLEIDGRVHRLARIRKKSESLVDEYGRPVADGVLAHALGGMTREAYRAMFSLDDETLEEGGEEILRSEGDLGRLLFASSAGLVELSRGLKQVRRGAEEFHRTKARRTKLRDLKAELSTLDQEKKAIDTAASKFARLVADRDSARSAYDQAMEERAKLETARDAVERRIQGRPWLEELQRLRGELRELESLPEVPETWSRDIDDLMDQEPRLSTELKGLQRQREELAARIEALPIDDEVLALESRIVQLAHARARHVTAEVDLPERHAQRREYDAGIRTIVLRLRDAADLDPASLVMSSGVTGVLNDLIERRSGIEERLVTTADEVKRTETLVGTAHRALEESAERVGDDDGSAFDRLNGAINAVQADDCRSRLTMHSAQRDVLQGTLDGQIAELHPWEGSAGILAGVRVPEAEEMESWQAALDRVAQEIDRLEGDCARLRAEQNRFLGLMQAKVTETGVVNDEEAARLRARRDDAWRTHRAVLDDASADAFQGRLEEDDEATAARIAHATELAALRQASDELRDITSEAQRNAEDLVRAQKQRKEVLEEVATAVQIMRDSGVPSLRSDTSLPKLRAWIQRRVAIQQTVADIRRHEAEIEGACRAETRLREALSKALTDAGVTHDSGLDIRELTTMARGAIEADKEKRTARSAAKRELDIARTELERRRADAEQARFKDAKWHTDWTEALSRCWLGEIEPEPGTAAVRRMLADVTDLESALEKRDLLAERIEKMEQDQMFFTALVQALAEQLGQPFDRGQVVAIGDALRARLDKAIHNRDTGTEYHAAMEKAVEEEGKAESRLAESRAVAGQMFEVLKVESLGDVARCLRRIGRRTELRPEVAKREAKLIAMMNTSSLMEAAAALEDGATEELERQCADIKARLEDVSQRTKELYLALGRAEDAIGAVGGDDAVALLEARRRAVLLEIEEGALEYLRTRLGIEAADRALVAYRDAHRSSMMDRASKAFRTISRGAYSGLDTQITDKGEVLVGVGASTGAKIASRMSKGARFQLYLALRVAGYHEFVSQYGPVPFVADDILETFDDFRTEEAFRLLAEAARVGQVICLSHHRHLCQIARDICPEISIHELPEPMPGSGTAEFRET